LRNGANFSSVDQKMALYMLAASELYKISSSFFKKEFQRGKELYHNVRYSEQF